MKNYNYKKGNVQLTKPWENKKRITKLKRNKYRN